MLKFTNTIVKHLPLVLQLRIVLCARRQHLRINKHPGLLALLAFIGPIACLVSYALHRLAGYLHTANLSIHPLLLTVIAMATGIGLKIQLQLQRDMRWNTFVYLMPVRPIHVLSIHLWHALPMGLLGLITLGACLGGADVTLASWRSGPVLLGLFILVVEIIWLPILLGMALTRSRYTRQCLLVVPLIWGIALLLRMIGHAHAWPLWFKQLATLLASDSLLALCGLHSLLDVLCHAREYSRLQTFLALMHSGLLTGMTILFAWQFLHRLPVLTNTATPRLLGLSRCLRKWYGPPPSLFYHTQFCIELIRMLRYGLTKLWLNVCLSIACGVFLHMSVIGEAYVILILPLFVMLAISERADFVKIREGDFLYFRYGVSVKSYVLGYTLAVGTLVSGLCFLQLPLLRNESIWTIVKCISACIILAYSSVIMCMFFDAYYRNTKIVNRLLTFILFLIVIQNPMPWHLIPPLVIIIFNIIYIPCLAYGPLLVCLSAINPVLALLAGAIALRGSVSKAQPGFIKKYCWRIEA